MFQVGKSYNMNYPINQKGQAETLAYFVAQIHMVESQVHNHTKYSATTTTLDLLITQSLQHSALSNLQHKNITI